jgi:hypothetical protein
VVENLTDSQRVVAKFEYYIEKSKGLNLILENQKWRIAHEVEQLFLFTIPNPTYKFFLKGRNMLQKRES